MQRHSHQWCTDQHNHPVINNSADTWIVQLRIIFTNYYHFIIINYLLLTVNLNNTYSDVVQWREYIYKYSRVFSFKIWIYYHDLTRGTSTALLVLPDLMQNGRDAQRRAIPLAVLSVYRGVLVMKGCTYSGSSNSSSSAGSGSVS